MTESESEGHLKMLYYTFSQVKLKQEIMDHYLGKFSIICKPVKHDQTGMGQSVFLLQPLQITHLADKGKYRSLVQNKTKIAVLLTLKNASQRIKVLSRS